MALKLSTFNIANAIVAVADGRPTVAFHRWINDTVKTIQSSVNDIGQLVADIAFSLERSGIAITTANAAKAAALAAAREPALVNSYVTPDTVLSSMIDATAATTANITITDHVRHYADGTTVNVTGATITGRAISTTYYVTYVDANRTGGTVAYTATTDYAAAGQGSDRHLVGSVTTPASGATQPSPGDPTTPPGVNPRTKNPRNVDENIE